MRKIVLSLMLLVFLFASFARAQSAEVTLQLNEGFFDSLLDAVFSNSKPLEFPLNANFSRPSKNGKNFPRNSFAADYRTNLPARCEEKITVLRELSGVRTAVRFRDGKIVAPIAFTGVYNPPLVGCLDFQGWAETNLELEFDKAKQTLYGRARVSDVKLGNVANLASGLIARFVQTSVDKKINPIEILKTDKLDFVVPVQQTNSALRLKANDLRYEVGENVLTVRVNLEFSKAD